MNDVAAQHLGRLGHSAVGAVHIDALLRKGVTKVTSLANPCDREECVAHGLRREVVEGVVPELGGPPARARPGGLSLVDEVKEAGDVVAVDVCAGDEIEDQWLSSVG